MELLGVSAPRRNDNLTLPSDEVKLLSSVEPRTSGTTPGSENLTDSSQELGFFQKRLQNLYNGWETYRSKPWNMCLLVVFGTLFALGHHLFYLALDGNEATNQSLMLRYGTILAFCAKASLGTAAAMAFQQRAWLVLRHKTARIETVDSIFTANTDIFSLLTWSSIKKAKVGVLIAIYCWITPLVVVLTSETLSVAVRASEVDGTCLNVRTLNFSNEKWIYWRQPMLINKRYLIPLSYWNTTAPGDYINKDDPNEFDYWSSPSQQWNDMVGFRVALSNEPLVRKETGPEVCTNGWNCSYVLSFVAPGYKCETLATGVNSKVRKLGEATPPFNTSVLAPVGNLTYYAKNDMGDYEDPQIASRFGGRPKMKPPFPKNLGAFRTEPIMWIGYCTVEDYTKPQPSRYDDEGWYEAYTPIIIGCEHYEVNYTIRFNIVAGVQSHKVLRREYLRRVVNTTLTTEVDPDKRLKDRTKAVPESNYVLPSDTGNHRLTAAYHSLGYVLRQTLNGTAMMLNFNVNSRILVTPLVDRINYLPVKNFGQAVRDMYEKMIVSLLADPSFMVVSWASNGKPSGVIKGGPSTAYPCRKQRYITAFEYNKAQLLIVYATSLTLAIAAVSVGIHAYREEGTMRDMKPSSIIEASRASDLHELAAKGEVKIGYGLVQEEAGRSVRSFGVEGNVTQP
jgi:hypothetical protein